MTEPDVRQIAGLCFILAVLAVVAAVVAWCRLCDCWEKIHQREADLERARLAARRDPPQRTPGPASRHRHGLHEKGGAA